MSTNVSIVVRDNDVQTALEKLRKKIDREGILRAVRTHEAYAKPLERRRLKHRKALTRQHKMERKLTA